MSDIRLDAMWSAVKDRLNDSQIDAVLYGTKEDGTSRVYRATEDFSAGEGDEGDVWGRIILIPAATLWEPVEAPGQTRKVNFLVRVEFNNYRAEGYDPTPDLEAAHEAVRDLLDGWTPTNLNGSRIVFNVYRRTYPQAMPFFDEQRKLWWTSAEYRFEAAKLTVA